MTSHALIVGRDLVYRSYSYHLMHADGRLIWRFDKHPLRAGAPSTSHLHLSDDEEAHLPYREVELDEVIDWAHRYVASQETPLPD